MPVSLTTLLVFSFALAGFGGSPAGIVVDPQGHLLVGAKAVLTCGQVTEAAWSDSQGRISFQQPQEGESCTLSVTYPVRTPTPSVAGTPDVILETGRNFALESELLILSVRLSIGTRYFA